MTNEVTYPNVLLLEQYSLLKPNLKRFEQHPTQTLADYIYDHLFYVSACDSMMHMDKACKGTGPLAVANFKKALIEIYRTDWTITKKFKMYMTNTIDNLPSKTSEL